MDSGFDTQNLPWLEFENEKLTWRELFLPSLPVLLVLYLFLGCLGQYMAAPARIRESRERLLVTEEEIGPAVVVS